MKIKLLALLCAVSLLSLTSPVTMEKEVHDVALGYLGNPENAGLAIGIISGGEESTWTFGTGNKSSGTVIDSASVFEIGSITKVFTGILLANEVVHNRMKLTDKVQTYLPVSSEAAKEITLVQLSTHSSGIPRLADNFWQSVKDRSNPYANYCDRDLCNYLNTAQLKTAPGTRYAYSNVGTGILGNILCKKYGTTYEELVKKKVCESFGMKNTTITLSANDKEHLAVGHSKGRAVGNWDFLDATAGQGALRSTIKDMMSFMRYNLEPEGKLKDAIEMAADVHFTDARTGRQMGLGWHISSFDGMKYLEHTGGTGGYRSFIGIIPGTNTGVIVLSNSDNDVNTVGIELLKIAAKHEKENRKTIVAN